MQKSNHDLLMRQLRAPFPRDKIKFRPGATTKDKAKGLALAYADARTFQDRLDDVWGVDNWESRCVTNDGGCICSITLHFNLDDGTSYARTKSDGAGATDVEGEKGAISDAFKRACVQWGIGRYLYSLSDMWVPLSNGRYIAEPDKIKLPDWALPWNSGNGEGTTPDPDASSGESFLDDDDPRLKRMIAIVLAIRKEFSDGAEHRIEGWCDYYSVEYKKAGGFVNVESIHFNERDKALANLVRLQEALLEGDDGQA